MRANFVHDYVRLEMNDHKKLLYRVVEGCQILCVNRVHVYMYLHKQKDVNFCALLVAIGVPLIIGFKTLVRERLHVPGMANFLHTIF